MATVIPFRLRAETADDQDAIRRVIEDAFAGAEHASGNEARIVDALRDAGALRLSLVADIDDRIVGHAALSPVTLDDGSPGWLGLGPVAVDPRDQGNGVGSALIRAALAELPALGGCVVVGAPAYYARFGFRQAASLRFPGVPPEYFMALSSHAPLPHAVVSYHPAFSVA